jgi:hypothetical protein
VDNLADHLQVASVSKKKLTAYSTASRDPYIVRTFLKDSTQYVEVDICFGAGAVGLNVTLAQDGMSIHIQRGVFSSFFATKRLRMTFGQDYNGDSSRVSAHSQAWDDFKKNERPLNGIVFSNDVQVITPPLKCSGLVEQTAHEFIPTGNTCRIPGRQNIDGTPDPDIVHIQFVAVATFRVMTVEQLEKEKKAVKFTVQH